MQVCGALLETPSVCIRTGREFIYSGGGHCARSWACHLGSLISRSLPLAGHSPLNWQAMLKSLLRSLTFITKGLGAVLGRGVM